MDDVYDVVVAGLGPGGASLVYMLSHTGLRVLGIDMMDWDALWSKPCGDAIGKHHFRETGIPDPRGDEVKQVVKGILIYSPSENTVFKVMGEGYIIDRNKVGKRLVKDAENKGAEILLRHRIVKPVIDGSNVSKLILKDNRGKTLTVKGKIIVEATGNSSVLRRFLPETWPISESIDLRDTNIAYREIRELDYEIENPEYIRIYLNQEISPGGYWWFFPEGRNKANIGLGVQGGMGYPHPKDVFYEKLDKREEVGRYIRILNAAGSFVPTRRPLDTLVWNNVIVIGDAGYTVNPVHGGGMGYAMYAAFQAKNAILNAYNNEINLDNLWVVNLGYMKTLGAKQASLDLFRIFLQRLSNDEIEYGMKYRVMKEEDVYDTSTTGEIKANISLLDKIGRILRGLGKPSLLLRLAIVAEYGKKAISLYKSYPPSPTGFKSWQEKVRRMYRDYINKIVS